MNEKIEEIIEGWKRHFAGVRLSPEHIGYVGSCIADEIRRAGIEMSDGDILWLATAAAKQIVGADDDDP